MHYLSIAIMALQSVSVVAGPVKTGTVPTSGSSARPWHSPVITDVRSDQVVACYEAGGPHGSDVFNDSAMVGTNHQRIGRINVWCDVDNNGQLQALSFDYRDNKVGKKDELSIGPIHGTNRNPDWKRSYTLELDEYITTVRVYTYKANGHTRIGSVVFNTNEQVGAFCGPKQGRQVTWGGEGQALSYVAGSSGRVVDLLRGNFIASDKF